MPDFSGDSRFAISRRGVVLAFAFLCVCIFMHAVSRQYPLLTATGLPALAQNLASLPLITLFAASCFSLGALVIRADGLPSLLDLFLLRSLAGFSLFTMLGYAIGMLQLLTHAVALATLTLPLLCFPGDLFGGKTLTRADRARLGLFAIILIWILCFSGVLHVYILDDFSHYYPMIHVALAHHSLAPNWFILASFYEKGAGANFLLYAASSETTAFLVTLYALGIIALLTYRLVEMATGNHYAATAGALLLLASKVVRIEAYKIHILISMLLLAIPYIFARLQLSGQVSKNRILLTAGLLLCACVTVSPPASVFLTVPLLFLLYLGFAKNKVLGMKSALTLAGTPFCLFLLILGLNYTLFGIAEITPPAFFSRYVDLSKIDRWIPAPMLQLVFVQNENNSGFLIPWHPLLLVTLKFTAATVAFLFLYKLMAHRKPFLAKRVLCVLGSAAALGVPIPFLIVVSQQTSLHRIVAFLPPLQMTAVAISMHVAIVFVSGLLRRRFSIDAYRPLTKFFFLLTMGYALVFNWTPKREAQLAATKAFVGQTSLTPLLGHWAKYAEVAQIVDATLPQGELVLTMQEFAYAWWLNPDRFIRIPDNPHMRELAIMLGNDVEAAAGAYRRAGIRHFLLNLSLDPHHTLLLGYAAGYSALFTPENIQTHFRAVPLPDDCWLLTLGGTDKDGPRPDKRFFAMLERKKQLDATNPNQKVIRQSLDKAMVLMPALALARGVDPKNLPPTPQ